MDEILKQLPKPLIDLIPSGSSQFRHYTGYERLCSLEAKEWKHFDPKAKKRLVGENIHIQLFETAGMQTIIINENSGTRKYENVKEIFDLAIPHFSYVDNGKTWTVVG